MSRPLRFLPEAREEYDDAVDWYAAIRTELGEDFITQVRQTLTQIAARPRMFPIIYRDARKARVKNFPYNIIFQEQTTEILIVAVYHTSRDPGRWQQRLG